MDYKSAPANGSILMLKTTSHRLAVVEKDMPQVCDLWLSHFRTAQALQMGLYGQTPIIFL